MDRHWWNNKKYIISNMYKSSLIYPNSSENDLHIILYLLLLLLSHFRHVRRESQTTAHQAPLSLRFSKQEYWSELPFPPPVHACMLSRISCVWLSVTQWSAAHQAPLSTGFSRQEYWSGLPFPSPSSLFAIVYFLQIAKQ